MKSNALELIAFMGGIYGFILWTQDTYTTILKMLLP